ncbi:MAG: hypothetical protein ACFCAD_06765 [Pleurocapsa sp.]
MTKIITDRDWDEIWAENYRNAEILSESNSFERTFKIDVPELGNCYDSSLKLRNGLWIYISKIEISQDFICLRDIFDCYQFGLSFFLSGKVKIQRHGLTDEIEELAGSYYSECNYDTKETEWWQTGEPFYRIYLRFEPQQFFDSFETEQMEKLPFEMRKFILEGNPPP